MKLIILILTTFLASSAYSYEVKVTSWSILNTESSSDSAAEVCFSVTPAPIKPVFAEILVDKNARTPGLYSTWVGPKGSTCHIVSTSRGRVQVDIPTLSAKTQLIK